MTYSYITNNNLVDRQNYMYSKYEGLPFLKDYAIIRETCINKIKEKLFHISALPVLPSSIVDWRIFISSLKIALSNLEQTILVYPTKDEIYTNSLLWDIIHIYFDGNNFYDNNHLMMNIDQILKSFEVRKRIYTVYNLNFKPISNNYYYVENYMLTSLIFGVIYAATHRFKYLNAQLKINDTLISLTSNKDLGSKANILMYYGLVLELSSVRELCNEKEIRMYDK